MFELGLVNQCTRRCARSPESATFEPLHTCRRCFDADDPGSDMQQSTSSGAPQQAPGPWYHVKISAMNGGAFVPRRGGDQVAAVGAGVRAGAPSHCQSVPYTLPAAPAPLSAGRTSLSAAGSGFCPSRSRAPPCTHQTQCPEPHPHHRHPSQARAQRPRSYGLVSTGPRPLVAAHLLSGPPSAGSSLATPATQHTFVPPAYGPSMPQPGLWMLP